LSGLSETTVVKQLKSLIPLLIGLPSAPSKVPGQEAENSNVKANTVGEQEHKSMPGICALAADIKTAKAKAAAVCIILITDKPR
jgi:hypothetical protein